MCLHHLGVLHALQVLDETKATLGMATKLVSVSISNTRAPTLFCQQPQRWGPEPCVADLHDVATGGVLSVPYPVWVLYKRTLSEAWAEEAFLDLAHHDAACLMRLRYSSMLHVM